YKHPEIEALGSFSSSDGSTSPPKTQAIRVQLRRTAAEIGDGVQLLLLISVSLSSTKWEDNEGCHPGMVDDEQDGTRKMIMVGLNYLQTEGNQPTDCVACVSDHSECR
uniref:Uncharacterized protein n=1 Tax=Triticum urartu TaxID=4572 RepID=A0A8R7UMW0_TRIUA